MKRRVSIVFIVLAALLAGFWLAGPLNAGQGALAPAARAPLAGSPPVVSYQGQVIVSGIAYNGAGYFKFAIVDQPTGCTISYWTNDGSLVDCTAPANAVTLDVSNGLFNVLLGDTAVTNMTALPASVFSGATRYLRVWFSSTGNAGSFEHLTPDRRIAAVPYALQATNADYLDGQDSAAFAPTSHAHDDAYVNDTGDSMSGTLVVNIPAGGSHGITSITASTLTGAAAVEAKNHGAGYGLRAHSASSIGIVAEGATYAGHFTGDVRVTGDLSVDGASPFQEKVANVVVVAKSGGDYTTISAALASITDAGDSNRYLVKVMPGVYNEQVAMKPYVDIEGAGELTTRITHAGDASLSTGTVLGADNAELRFLTVENTGGSTHAVAIYNGSVSPRLTHLTATAWAGLSGNYGVYNNDASPAMTHVIATASGTTSTLRLNSAIG